MAQVFFFFVMYFGLGGGLTNCLGLATSRRIIAANANCEMAGSVGARESQELRIAVNLRLELLTFLS